VRAVPDHPSRSRTAAAEPGPARLYALLLGALLCLLGVAGFFYDASFDTGDRLASDYLAGTLLINGWRNVLYLLTGVAALAFAARAPRFTAAALGGLYVLLGVWGLIETERGIGSILDVLPLGGRDNAFHLVIGLLGVGAALIDGPLPSVKLPKRPKRRPPAKAKAKPRPKPKTEPKEKDRPRPRSEPAARARRRAAPRPADDA
jgi:hypothetical protein